MKPRVSVLIVDDVSDLRLLTRLALRHTEFHVVAEAADGAAAIEMAGRERPQLVLLDLSMPVMDGLEALPRIKRASPDSTVVVLSGFAAERMSPVAKSLGAAGYLEKGLAPDKLVESLRSYVPKTNGHRPPLATVAATADEERRHEFAYLAAHDLKEPLRTVTGFLNLLKTRLGPDARAETVEMVGHALDATARMERMVEALLDYSRAGSSPPEPRVVGSDVALEAALEALRPKIADAGAVIERGELPAVHADPGQLVQVLQGLIDNAVKFRRDVAPRVRVEATQDGKEWVFEVADNGIGIDPRHKDRLFEVFQRLHPRDRYPGAGVGLAICKKLVEQHGGRIDFDSTPGSGSTFRFTLPVREGLAAEVPEVERA